MEPWEALDLDCSDVHSLIHPLKRHRSPQSLSGSATSVAISSQSLPILKPCSRPPVTVTCQSQSDNRQPDSNFSPPNLSSHSRRISNQLETPCSSAPSAPHIPGPAGDVLAAMQRRTRAENCFYVCDEEPVPTQEYIRRVIENGEDEDDDFNGNPWLCALDFVRGLGALEGNGAVLKTPLNSIKNGFNAEKIALVVAIIKSCTSNGLGDLMVTLKDPTGTLDASIHHKVFSEGNLGKDLSVGAVLILKKVAVFSATRFAHVLNITSSNVIKVISEDSGPPIKQKDIELLGSLTGESQGEVHTLEKVFAVSHDRTENIMNNLRQTSKLKESGFSDQQTGEINAAPFSNCKGDGNSRNQQTVTEKDGLVLDLGVSNESSRKDFDTFPADRDQEAWVDEQNIHDACTETDILPEGPPKNVAESNLTQVPNDQVAEKMVEVQKTTTLTPRSLLPQWTDEQLDELFVFD